MSNISYQAYLLFFVFEAEVLGVWICDHLLMGDDVPVFHILNQMVMPHWNLQKESYWVKFFQNGFRHVFFQQLRDNFIRSSIMLTKYPSGEFSSCQKGPNLVSEKKMVSFIHILNFLRFRLDCAVMIQRTKHRIIRYNGGKDVHPHVQEYFIFSVKCYLRM